MQTFQKGIIHGKTIELETEPGFPEGQEVAVILHPLLPDSPTSPAALESLRRAAGAWAGETDDLDRYLEWNRQQRKGNRPEIPG